MKARALGAGTLTIDGGKRQAFDTYISSSHHTNLDNLNLASMDNGLI